MAKHQKAEMNKAAFGTQTGYLRPGTARPWRRFNWHLATNGQMGN
jgi:hypothetical protein